MSTKHTPAPHHAAWAAIREARRWLNTARAEAKINALVALNAVRDEPSSPEAMLADAAPELLETLRAVLDEAEQFARAIQPYSLSEAIASARAAIRKATGEQ